MARAEGLRLALYLVITASMVFGGGWLCASRAQTVIVTTSTIQQRSQTASVDTSLSLSGAGLTIPGALNARREVPVSSLATVEFVVQTTSGEETLQGSLAGFGDLIPSTVVLNTSGDGFRAMTMNSNGVKSLTLSTTVPGVTRLSFVDTAILSGSGQGGTLTVFP